MRALGPRAPFRSQRPAQPVRSRPSWQIPGLVAVANAPNLPAATPRRGALQYQRKPLNAHSRRWGPRLSPTRFSLTGADPGWKPSRTDRAPRRQAKNALHYGQNRIMYRDLREAAVARRSRARGLYIIRASAGNSSADRKREIGRRLRRLAEASLTPLPSSSGRLRHTCASSWYSRGRAKAR